MDFKFTPKEWSQLVNVISFLSKSDNCTDLDIKDGHIRVDNDFRSATYDLTLPKPIDITLSSAKDIIPIMNMFNSNDDANVITISVKDGENKFTISDSQSAVEYPKANRNLCNNSFISDEIFENKYNKYINTEMISMIQLNPAVMNRILVLISTLNVIDVLLVVKDKKATIAVNSQSKTKKAKVITIDNIHIEDGIYSITTSAFQNPWEGLELCIYEYNKSANQYILKVNGSISELPITIFYPMSLKKEK
jgi:hypothetical protein